MMYYSDSEDDESSTSSSSSDDLTSDPDLNEFNIDLDYLPSLYRVQLPTSATHYDSDVGFTARSTSLFSDPTTTPVTNIDDALAEHLNWRSNVRSPFISVFDNEEHAVNWALAWSRAHDNETCTIYEIDPRQLDSTWVFEADQLIDVLDLYVPAHLNVDGEYLVLHEIPVEAIQVEWDVEAEDCDNDESSDEDEDNEKSDGEESDGEESDGYSDDGYGYGY